MSYSSRVSLTIITLSIVILACAMPAITLEDAGAISTAAAETVIAGYVQAALSATLSPTLPEPTLTNTPEPPTFTPTFTETPTQTLTATPLFTSTPFVPQISVSVSTNCRIGPGKVYQRVGALLIDEVAQVYGRDPPADTGTSATRIRAADFAGCGGNMQPSQGILPFFLFTRLRLRQHLHLRPNLRLRQRLHQTLKFLTVVWIPV